MNPRLFVALAIGEALVLTTFVIAVVANIDVSSFTPWLRAAVVLGAAIVAVATYQAWSHSPTSPSLAAMLAALLGGAAVVSTAVSAKGDNVYASDTVALVGTVGLVAAVLVGQVALAQLGKQNQGGKQQS